MKLVYVHRYSHGAVSEGPVFSHSPQEDSRFSPPHESELGRVLVMPTAPTVVHNPDSGRLLMMSTVAAA